MGIEINPSVLRMLSPAEQLVVGGRALEQAAPLLRIADDAARLAGEAAEPANVELLTRQALTHLDRGVALSRAGTEAIGLAAGTQQERAAVDAFARSLGWRGPLVTERRLLAVANDDVVAGLRELLAGTGSAPQDAARVGTNLIDRIESLGARARAMGEAPGGAISTKRPLAVFMDGPVDIQLGDLARDGVEVHLPGVVPQPADSAVLDGSASLGERVLVEHSNLYHPEWGTVRGIGRAGSLG